MRDDKPSFAEKLRENREKPEYKAQSRKNLWQIAAILGVGVPVILVLSAICAFLHWPSRTYLPIVTGIGLATGKILGTYLARWKTQSELSDAIAPAHDRDAAR
jgi:hypothetical protein